jgi:hypothetical protein
MFHGTVFVCLQHHLTNKFSTNWRDFIQLKTSFIQLQFRFYKFPFVINYNTVSDYGLDDRGSNTGRGKGYFSSLCVQTGSGAHLASYPMGTGVSFPRGKAWPGRDADHSPPSSAEVKNE